MIFLKCGGSLITEKSEKESARHDIIRRLADEIAEARSVLPTLKLLIGHGSGSFGHHAAQRYGTHRGAKTPEDWFGFLEVLSSAHRLHHIFMDALHEAGLPALSFPPSSLTITEDNKVVTFALEPLQTALQHDLIPVVYGDVAFDLTHGAGIVSTEKILSYLAIHLHPTRFLLAGKAPGVLASGEVLPTLDQQTFDKLSFHEPEGADVTGGMRAKVQDSLSLAATLPELDIQIFSAEQPGTLRNVLLGDRAGTRIIGD